MDNTGFVGAGKRVICPVYARVYGRIPGYVKNRDCGGRLSGYGLWFLVDPRLRERLAVTEF